MSVAYGVWCGLPRAELLAPVGQPGDQQVPLLRITLQRLRHWGLKPTALIPWQADYDPLATDVAAWFGGTHIERTHEDERIAMRDLVADKDASIGVLIYGTAAVIDLAEIRLAIARLKDPGVDVEKYLSPRMCCRFKGSWLLTNEDNEWVEPMNARDTSLFYAGKDAVKAEARAIKARKG